MRILVTGASGQLARELAEADTRNQCDFYGRDRLDLGDGDAVRRILTELDFDLLINAAAYTAVDKAEEETEAAFALNATAPGILAEIAAAKAAPIVHVSTDYVFDGTKSGAYLPNDPTAPINVYGASKLAGEIAVAQANPKHLILRTSWVYSPLGNNFVKTMLRLGADRDALTIVSDQYGGPTHAGDLAEAILGLTERMVADDGIDWGLHHFCGSGVTNWAAFAEEIFKQGVELGLIDKAPSVTGIPSKDYPTPAKRPLNSALDCASFDHFSGYIRPDWQVSLNKMLLKLGS